MAASAICSKPSSREWGRFEHVKEAPVRSWLKSVNQAWASSVPRMETLTMSYRKWFGYARAAAVALLALAFVASNARAGDNDKDPIVGLWLITVSGGGFTDNVFSGWTRDGLEFDQDTAAPILSGYVCYGHWIKLKDHTYALTHPFFNYKGVPSGANAVPPDAGEWDGTSGYFNYVVSVSDDGKTFTGKENGVNGVPGPNPYAGTGTPFSGLTLSATKIRVDKSLLP